MAASIVRILRLHGAIQQPDELAQDFARLLDGARGYGMGAWER